MISKLNQSNKRRHLKSLLRWLRIVPVIFLVLLGCGQVALHNTIPTVADTQSRLIADYKTWEFNTFHPLHQAILKDIQRDKSNFPTLFNDIPEVILHPGSNWPKTVKTYLPQKTIMGHAIL